MKRNPQSNIYFVPVLLLFIVQSQASMIELSASIDTSSINGQSGALDLQFNPGTAAVQSATATLSNFATDAALGSAINDGGASGTLPGTVDIANSDAFLNAVLQDITYGNHISFDLILSGPAVDSPLNNGVATDFIVYLWDDDPFFPSPLLSVAPFGEILRISLLSDATTSVSTYDADSMGTPSVMTVTQAGSVPVPPIWLLSLPGLLGIFRSRPSRLPL